MIKSNLLNFSCVWDFYNKIVQRIWSNSFWYSKIRLFEKNKRILTLINKSVTTGFSVFITKHISNHIIKNN